MAPFKVVIADQPAADHEVESAALAASGLMLDTVWLGAREPERVLEHAADADALVCNTATYCLDEVSNHVLAEHRIAGAGLDVFEVEPLPDDDPLHQLDNVARTPHSASWSVESSAECRRVAVEHVVTVLRGGVPAEVVNRAVLARRHAD